MAEFSPFCFEIQTPSSQVQDDRGFIAGSPLLPVGSEWPTCRLCGDKLVHFIDIELPHEDSIKFRAGSRLQVFACREHDDIAGTIYSGYAQHSVASSCRSLPDNYWEINDGHYLIRLLPPNESVAKSGLEVRLDLKNLDLRRRKDSTSRPKNSFKLFGEPHWVQDPEEHICCCGAEMRLLLQIPDGEGFEMTPNAPEQPNSFSRNDYCLFLGNQLYLLACEQQCHPMALWPVLQN